MEVKSLSERITDSFRPLQLHDPEDESDDDTAPKLADLKNENQGSSTGLSEIRMKNVHMLSDINEKYSGKFSKRNIRDGTSSSDADDSEISSDEVDRFQDDSEDSEDRRDETSDSAEDEKYFDNRSEVSGTSVSNEGETQLDTTEMISESADQVKKGLAVQNQLKMWEKLLELRIHSQKVVLKSNSLPFPEKFKFISQKSEEFSKLTEAIQENVMSTLTNLLEMQKILASQYSESESLFKEVASKRKSSSNLLEPPLKKFATEIEENLEIYKPYCHSVIRKWEDRVKLLTPGNHRQKGFKGLNNNLDLVQKIDILLGNRGDLIRKSQTVKGNYRLFDVNLHANENVTDENIADENFPTEAKDSTVRHCEIYDDSDFYHQQLRELIEYKSGSSFDPSEMSKQLAELQKMRNKMKKKVDTRASKGRKIRYAVHNKMVNFMAPNTQSEWTDESRNELYKSLFGT